tara:strand:- start:18313 stop:18570 length:258 start_codon:yes stop_codon:yes gene_type:complete
MDDYDVAMPLITFNVVYKAKDKSDDKTFDMKSVALPRVGELLKPQAGASLVVVSHIIHNPVSHPELGHLLSPTVVVKDIPSPQQA